MTQSLATLRTGIRQHIMVAAQRDERIVGLVDYGSSSEGRADTFSDLDLALFIRDSDLVSFEQDWKSWAAQFGPLLLAYVGGVGHPWTVYDAWPLPLRVDFAFHPASALATILTWPNAPMSTQAMVLYDATEGKLTSYVEQLVGQSLRPINLQQTFERVCGDFWYYVLRTWTKLLRGDVWVARYDFNVILLGNLMGLLRLEANAVERWRNTSAATSIEQILPPHRLAQLRACIPAGNERGLQRAFSEAAHLGYQVSAAIAAAHGWTWPQKLADRVLTIVES
ncbi:MAG: aminoglycoside 6-adenylyltransferase [Chloroflexota bacterium]|nr:aminoglycoside 6-adenylyltransferase [Chloroflexota bacterium]